MNVHSISSWAILPSLHERQGDCMRDACLRRSLLKPTPVNVTGLIKERRRRLHTFSLHCWEKCRTVDCLSTNSCFLPQLRSPCEHCEQRCGHLS